MILAAASVQLAVAQSPAPVPAQSPAMKTETKEQRDARMAWWRATAGG